MDDDDDYKEAPTQAVAQNISAVAVDEPAPETHPLVMMHHLTDKLALLDYEKKFCAKFDIAPLTTHYFAIPDINPSEQFYVFTSLLSWLLNMISIKFDPPQQYEDPNAVSTNVISALKKAGLSSNFPPAKLKQGHGEIILDVLNNVVDRIITGLDVRKPAYEHEEFTEEAQVDEAAEVTTNTHEDDIEEDIEMPDVEDDLYIEMEEGGASSHALIEDQDTKPGDVVENKVNMLEWKLELERVHQQLKAPTRQTMQSKDWRTHYQQMKGHKDVIDASLAAVEEDLDILHKEISKTLEKISAREKYINGQMEGLLGDYKEGQTKLADVKNKYETSSTQVKELTVELQRISDELETVKSEMDERGTNMTDSKPLVRIKKALQELKVEKSKMELRIGVVENSLLAARLSNKAALRSGAYNNNTYYVSAVA